MTAEPHDGFYTTSRDVTVGADPQSFPITGFGLGGLLLALEVIRTPSSHFPFGVIQATLAAPILALAVWRLSRAPTNATLLDSGATLTAVLLFFGRAFNDNYVASLLVLFVLALAASRDERRTDAMASTHGTSA